MLIASLCILSGYDISCPPNTPIALFSLAFGEFLYKPYALDCIMWCDAQFYAVVILASLKNTPQTSLERGHRKNIHSGAAA